MGHCSPSRCGGLIEQYRNRRRGCAHLHLWLGWDQHLQHNGQGTCSPIMKELNRIGQIRSRGGAVPIHQIGVGLVFQQHPLNVTASMWWTGFPTVKEKVILDSYKIDGIISTAESMQHRMGYLLLRLR